MDVVNTHQGRAIPTGQRKCTFGQDAYQRKPADDPVQGSEIPAPAPWFVSKGYP